MNRCASKANPHPFLPHQGGGGITYWPDTSFFPSPLVGEGQGGGPLRQLADSFTGSQSSNLAPKLRAGSSSGSNPPEGLAAGPAARGRNRPRPRSASSSPPSTITSPHHAEARRRLGGRLAAELDGKELGPRVEADQDLRPLAVDGLGDPVAEVRGRPPPRTSRLSVLTTPDAERGPSGPRSNFACGGATSS